MARKPVSVNKGHLILEDLKAAIKDGIDALRSELTELSLRIHSNPETGFKEVKAAGWLTDYLKQKGFSVEYGICGLETAFRASYGGGKPVIALLAEYDALPGLGHACGHNLIAMMSVGAGITSRQAVDRYGGTVRVIGTPAEEMHGGKVLMAERGAFDGLDAAMMVHPDVRNMAVTKFLACQNLSVEFVGRAAHAAARPDAGINALEAILQSFTGINGLRQHIRPSARIHGIITDGGEAANIVPAHSAGTFVVRAEDNYYLEELKEKVLNCFIGAAVATGARLEYKWSEHRYAPLHNNQTLACLFQKNLQSLGRQVYFDDPTHNFGSSDMGNVSQLVPAIHPSIAIAPEGALLHSVEFAQAAASDFGIQGMLDGAKALAMTIADVLSGAEILARVKADFSKKENG